MNKLRLADDLPRDLWLKLRRRGIGGSDASVVLGINQYKSILELWMEKIGQVEAEESIAEAAYWGQILEPVVREEFIKRSGLNVQLVPFLLQHETHRFMLANLDGMVDDPVYGRCVFEAKTSSAYKKEEWENGIPEEYYAQIQHYLAVTGWNGAYIAALIGGNEFLYRFIARDEAYIETLIQKEKVFWQCVKERKMPLVDGSKATEEFLKREYKQAKATTIILDASNQKWLDQYHRTTAAIKQLETEQREAENNLKQLMGEYEIAYIGKNEIRWPNITQQRLDSKLLKMNEPDIYVQYLKENSSRRFSIKCSQGA